MGRRLPCRCCRRCLHKSAARGCCPTQPAMHNHPAFQKACGLTAVVWHRGRWWQWKHAALLRKARTTGHGFFPALYSLTHNFRAVLSHIQAAAAVKHDDAFLHSYSSDELQSGPMSLLEVAMTLTNILVCSPWNQASHPCIGAGQLPHWLVWLVGQVSRTTSGNLVPTTFRQT